VTPPRARRARFPALRHRNLTLIWSGPLVSNMGTWTQNVAQSWLIYKLTGNDPWYLGLLGLSFAIPMVVVPPLGGVVVDRVDRVRLLYVTQTGSLLLAATLAILTWSGLVVPDQRDQLPSGDRRAGVAVCARAVRVYLHPRAYRFGSTNKMTTGARSR
jgi:MFS family permease